MYHPYFRGKQYELITIREMAALMARAGFAPIIEPVKESLGGLDLALRAVCDAEGSAILVVNPYHGVHAEDGRSISTMLAESFSNSRNISAGILLKKDMTLEDAIACCDQHRNHELTLVHAGFTDAKGLADALGNRATAFRHVFFEPECGKLYRRHFASDRRVLLRDGFKRKRNRDYEPVEAFSDLHVTFPDEGMTGFGDFLIVGDDFSESGGPAYAVAIHLTFIDPNNDNAMFIYHFVSKSRDTPTDPAGKFGEALQLMMAKLAEPNNHIFLSSAVKEFQDLYARGHFPGLGYIKKLSMNHHIETLDAFFRE